MWIIRKIDMSGGVFWQVGHYKPDGEFKCFRLCDHMSEAMQLCSYLNGGLSPDLDAAIFQMLGNMAAKKILGRQI